MLAKPLSHVASALLLLTSVVSAAPGDLDAEFLTNVGDGLTGSGYPERFPTGAVQALGIQPDGKILIGSGGGMSRFNNTGELTALKRLNADGTLDGAFAPNTAFTNGPHTTVEGEGAEVNVILVNPDGSFYIGGVFANYGPGSPTRSCLARVNADGTLDTNFVPPVLTGSQRYIQALALDGQGGLLVGGSFFTSGRNNLIRLDAATGALDPSFTLSTAEFGYPGVVDSISLAPDGRVYIAGATTTFRACVYRLQASGTVDSSFLVPFNTDSARVNKVLALPDGRVLFGGGFTLAGRPQGDFLAAVDANGSLDASFMSNLGTSSNGWVGGVLQQLPDGRVLAGGIFNVFNGTPIASLMILGTDGVRDTTFTPEPYTDDRETYITHFYAAGVQPSGKIVAGGWFERLTDPELDIRNLVRFEGLTPAGAAGSLAFVSASHRALENAGSITVQVARLPGATGAVSVNYATGGGTAVAGTDYTATSGTLNWADGEGGLKSITIPLLNNATAAAAKTFSVTLSAASGGATLGTISQTQVTIVDDDALPVIVTPPANVTLNQGSLLNLGVRVASPLTVSFQWQFNSGSGFQGLPGQFSPSLLIGQVTPASHSGQYRVVVTNANGFVESAAATVTILTPDGSLVPGFNSIGLPAQVLHAAPAANGKTVVITNDSSPQLRRLNADGSPDSSFTVSGFSNAVYDLLVLPDQRILVTGFFTTVTSPSNGTGTPVARLILARFNADGSFDAGYSPSLPANAGVFNGVYGSQLGLGAGGKFYVGYYGGGGLRRYHADGSLDGSFTADANIATGSQGEVRALRELPDGKLLISFLSGSNGFSFTRNFWRLNADGSRDLTFTDPGAETNTINAIDLLPDGRIAVAGNFTGFSTISPVPMRNVALLLPNGQVDLTFRSPVPNSTIEQILHHNGRLLVSGYFESFSNPVTTAGRVARLNLDGSIDASFITGSGANNRVSALFIDADGDLFLGGDFTSFNSTSRTFAAKLLLNDELGSLGFDPARVTVTEETRTLQLTVKRYGPTEAAASIDWATTEITAGGPDTPATAGDDFAEASGTLTWEAGDSSSRTIQIQLLDDALQEATEAFQVVLSSPSGPVTAAANATIRLLDSDTPVTFSQQPTGASLLVGGTLNLSGAATSPTPIRYQWLRNGQPVTGATSASFSKTGIALTDAGVYVLQATNAAGDFFSNAALVIIQTPASGIAGGWPTNLVINQNGNAAAGDIHAIVPTADGGAYIGGQFTSFNGQSGYDYLVKVSATGVVDTSFNPAANGIIEEMALQDGKLFVLGTFTEIGGGDAFNKFGTTKFAALDPSTGARLTSYMSNLTTAPAGSQTSFRTLTVLSDGDLLIGGDFIQFNGSDKHKYFARLNPDGTLDAGFDTEPDGPPMQTLSQISSAFRVVEAVVATSDGGFYAAGQQLRASIPGTVRDRFVKFNANGAFDPSFSASTAVNTSFTRIRLLPDGQLMASGLNLPGPTGATRRLTRITSTGSAASDFSGPTSQTYNDFVCLPDGRTLAIGSGFVFGATSNVVMFNATGGVDTSWPSGSGFNGIPLVTELAANGEIWIGGQFTAYNNVPVQRLLRLAGNPPDPAIVNAPVALGVNPDATAFFSVGAVGTNLSYQWFKDDVPLEDGGNLSGATSAVLTITDATLADDDFYHVEVTGGSPANTVASEPVRLRVLGAPEIATPLANQSPARGATVTLAPEVYAATPATYVWTRNGVVIQNGGRYSGANTATLIIQGATNADNGVYLLTITNDYGSDTTSATVTVDQIAQARDTSLSALGVNSPGTTSNIVNTFLHLPDGRTLIGGNGSFVGTSGSTASGSLAVVSTTGVVSTVAGGFNGSVTTLFRQADGKILVGGGFTNVNNLGGVGRTRIARLNADLTFDTSFQAVGASNTVQQVVSDSQGRIYLQGAFFNYDNQTGYSNFVRLNPDGSHDRSFNPIYGASALALRVLPGDKLLLAGSLNAYTIGGVLTNINGIVRLLPNGSVDPDFTPGLPASSSVYALDLDSSGRIVVAGYANGPGYFVRRLQFDGAHDTGFSFTETLDNQVFSLAVQSNGKVLLGGAFTTPRTRFLRLNSNGSLDTGFDVGTGFTHTTGFPTVNAVAIDLQGRIWVGGNRFTRYNDVTANAIAVLQGDGPTLLFTQQPGSLVRDLGTSASFSAAATANNGLTYRWQKNGTPLNDDNRISGTRTSTLQINNLQLADIATYTVVVSTPSENLTSYPASLLVLAAPEILTNPAALTRDVGATAVFSGSARGAGTLNYQWFHFDTPLSNGGGVSGATTPTLTLSNVNFDRAGDYRLRVTNTLGTAHTEFGRLTVEQRPGALAAGLAGTISTNGSVMAILRLADGSMLIGGQISSVTVNGVTTNRSRLARFLPDGSLDTAFNPTLPGAVRAIAQDSAGRVFIAGDFNGSVTIGGVTANRNRVARLTSDLVLDTAFDTSTVGPNANLTALAPTENGGVYIGGNFGFNQYGTTAVNRIARLTATGALDTGFTAASPAINNEVFCLLRRADGKLYAGGIFGTRLLNANGSQDTGFVPDAPFPILGVQGYALLMLPDNSLILSGNGANPQNYVRRINANTGVTIGNFATNHFGVVQALALQADGKLLSGSIGVLKRTDTATGVDDSGFAGFGSSILALAVDNSGRIWVGGSFNQYGGVAQNNLAVLNGGNYEIRDGQRTPQTLTFAPIADRVFNPAANSFTVNPSSTSGLPVTVSVTSGPATVAGNTVTITGAGEVTLTASQAGDDTYAPATLVRSFTVAKGQQTITFNAPADRAAASAPFNLNASASSGLPVSFELIDGPATLEGNTLTLTGELGTIVLTASQDGDANWEPAEPVERSFEALDVPPVTLSQVLSFPKLPAKRFLSESPVTLFASASSGLEVQFEVLSGPATVAGNALTFTGIGKVTVRASQSGGPGFHPAASITQSFSIVADPTKPTFTNLVQIYDGSPREVGVVGTSDDPVITYVIAGTEGPNAPVNAGTYTVKAVADGKTITGKLVVAKAPLTVTPDSQRRFIGEENPVFTLGYTGFQGDDTRESVFAEPGAREPTVSTSAKTTSPGGVYPIQSSGGLLANYAFVYVNGSLSVESFAGRYEALLTDAGRNVAKLELTVAASSTVFTGKLCLAGEAAPLSIKGTLEVDAEAETATGSMTPLTSKSGVLYELTLDFVLGEGFSAELAADAVPLAATEEGRRLYTPAKGDVITFAGTHTLILEPAAGGTPGGSGYGLAAIDSKAVMKLAGRLGDGTPYTAALQPDEQSGYRLFLQPYKRANSYLAGPLDLEEHPNLEGRRYLSTEATALLDWEKVGNAKDKSYRDGFGPDSVQVTLDPWIKPDKTTSLASLLDLDAGGDFQVLHGAIGSESDLDLPTDLQLDAKNKLLVTAPVTDPVNVTKWTASLNAGTGLILGSFQVSDEIDAPTAKDPNATKRISRKVSFIGVLRQPHGTSGPLGRGQALVPALPTDETNEIRAENLEFEW